MTINLEANSVQEIEVNNDQELKVSNKKEMSLRYDSISEGKCQKCKEM